MKILIIGGTGVIGSKLVNHFTHEETQVEFTYHGNKIPSPVIKFLDITDSIATKNLITKIKPDYVIHTAAVTNVDLCETNTSLADSVNIKGTLNVVEGCKESRSSIIYVSTSFVFDGTKEIYSEEDTTSPTTHYGLTKSKGEEIVRSSNLPHLILRTDQPYCWIENWQHTNSVLRVIQTLESGKILKEISNWYNTPTYVPDFVKATAKLMELNKTGTYHVVGPDFINRYEWAITTAEIFGLDKNKIESINSNSLNLPAKRVNVKLDNRKLLNHTGIKMRGLREGLNDMLNNKNIV